MLAGLIRVWLLTLGLLAALPALAQDDVGRLTRLLQDSLSGAGREVTITGFRGALSSQATIETLTIADDQGVWLTMSGVTLDWNRAALLAGTLSVRRLAAEGACEALPTSTSAVPPSTTSRRTRSVSCSRSTRPPPTAISASASR